jgi:uncharacterized membrane protein
MRSPFPFGCLALLVFLGVLLAPLFLANALLAALDKLGLSLGAAILAAIGIFFGGLVNIPVKRIEREETIEVVTPGLFGLRRRILPWVQRQETVIALNLGGAVVPLILVAHEIGRIARHGGPAKFAVGVGVAANVLVCYWLARPVPGVGIAMTPLLPAVVAAAAALLLAPDFAPPVAFVSGVLGPVIGADLLHLREVRETPTRLISIGGAGTFDGIVLSGLVAVLLA